LEKILTEKKRLQKRTDENKALEDKVEKMTAVATKEKKALQEEMEEHKKFMKHIQTLRDEKEAGRKALENEKKEILESTQMLQSKKTALIESKKDLEVQYQKEIDELECELSGANIAHEKRKQGIVKNRVMSYLRLNGHDVADVENRGGKQLGEKDIQAMVNAKVQSELKKKGRNMADNIVDDDDDYSVDSYEDRRDDSRRESSRKGEMKLEIDILRRELDIARASTPRGGATPRSSTLTIDAVPRSPYLHSEPAYFASPRASGRTPRFSSGNRSRFDSFDDEDRHGEFTTGLRSPTRTPFSRASPSSRTPRSHASPRHYF